MLRQQGCGLGGGVLVPEGHGFLWFQVPVHALVRTGHSVCVCVVASALALPCMIDIVTIDSSRLLVGCISLLL